MSESSQEARCWFAVGSFDDSQQGPVRQLLLDLIHGLFFLQLLYLLMIPFVVGWSPFRLLLLLVHGSFLLGMRVCLKRGHVRLVAVLLPVSLYCIFAILTFKLGGVRTHTFSYFGIMIIFVGIIWGGKGAFLTFLLVLATGGVLVWMEIHGSLPSEHQAYTPESALATYMLSFFLLLWLVLGEQRRLRALTRDALTKAEEIKSLHDAAEIERASSTQQFEQLLEEQRDTTQQLRQSNDELTSFSHAISHDLRAPMGLLVSLSEALEEDCGEELSEDAVVYLTRIQEIAGRLDRVVADLLRYSRLSRSALTLEQVTLGTLFGDVQEHLSQPMEERGARLELEGLDIHVIGNHSILFQVVQNLVSNAIKFVPEGTQPLVKVWAECSEEMVKVWVEDNGIGVDATHAERIFRPFERLHGIHEYPGTGLGLSIVRKGIMRLGGDCGVVPSEGGSRFWFSLPLRVIPKPGA